MWSIYTVITWFKCILGVKCISVLKTDERTGCNQGQSMRKDLCLHCSLLTHCMMYNCCWMKELISAKCSSLLTNVKILNTTHRFYTGSLKYAVCQEGKRGVTVYWEGKTEKWQSRKENCWRAIKNSSGRINIWLFTADCQSGKRPDSKKQRIASVCLLPCATSVALHQTLQ